MCSLRLLWTTACTHPLRWSDSAFQKLVLLLSVTKPSWSHSTKGVCVWLVFLLQLQLQGSNKKQMQKTSKNLRNQVALPRDPSFAPQQQPAWLQTAVSASEQCQVTSGAAESIPSSGSRALSLLLHLQLTWPNGPHSKLGLSWGTFVHHCLVRAALIS